MTEVKSNSLKNAAIDLAMTALPFTKGHGLRDMRNRLKEAVLNVNQALSATEDPQGPILDTSDPETLVNTIIEQGIDWQEFVAAVTKNTMKGSRRSVSKHRKNS